VAHDTLNRLLNPEQLLAVQHQEGPLLVLAGAGSGKTRIVTFRIFNLIQKGVLPDQILAVTFTNKAAGEMKERVEHLMEKTGFRREVTICTFHSLGVRILRESIDTLGYKRDFVIYDEDDADKLLKMCIQTLNIKSPTEEKGNFIKGLRALISQSKNQLLSPEELVGNNASTTIEEVFPKVFSLYQAKLKEFNAVDFDDLLFLTAQLFKNHPAIREKYQQRWPYLLIDEYQDTNHSQYMIARWIVEKNRNIFVVGDPDQSIYSWRGANIKNILNFEKDYPGAKIIRLEQNYRSTSTILEAANALIQVNTHRYEKNLWSMLGLGEKITLYVAADEREEAQFVINEIEDLNRVKKIPYNEITIFYRTNFQSRTFEDALLRRRIPYIIVGGISFYQRREIKDILAFLHMVLLDNDFIAFLRTINLPKRGIGEASIEKIRQLADSLQLSIFECSRQLLQDDSLPLRLTSKQKEGLREYLDIINRLREIEKEGSLHRLVSETVRLTRYLEVLKEDKETFDDRKANLDELISKAFEWQLSNESSSSSSSSLGQFLEELTLNTTLDEVDPTQDKVNLMTLHNGKGLEFRAGFLVGMEEDLFPHANSRDSVEAVEEERRLCYVGMTRAKECLYLTASRSRFIWGSFRAMRPSRFLREIPREHIIRLA
jgi:DNA helicase II / ATP-dependent DNA helicase PcrA